MVNEEVKNMEFKLYRCAHCGNIVFKVVDKGVPIMCCGEKMQELIPNTTDAATEKHVPMVEKVSHGGGSRVTVKVGSAPHPMTEEHSIQWVYLETTSGGQRKCLKPGDDPKVTFALCPGDQAVAAYAYCNLHGLWKAEA